MVRGKDMFLQLSPCKLRCYTLRHPFTKLPTVKWPIVEKFIADRFTDRRLTIKWFIVKRLPVKKALSPEGLPPEGLPINGLPSVGSQFKNLSIILVLIVRSLALFNPPRWDFKSNSILNHLQCKFSGIRKKAFRKQWFLNPDFSFT